MRQEAGTGERYRTSADGADKDDSTLRCGNLAADRLAGPEPLARRRNREIHQKISARVAFSSGAVGRSPSGVGSRRRSSAPANTLLKLARALNQT